MFEIGIPNFWHFHIYGILVSSTSPIYNIHIGNKAWITHFPYLTLVNYV